MSATRTEQITGVHGKVITSRMDDLQTVRALAAKAAQPAPLALRVLALELAELGLDVSSARLVQIASRCVVAQCYSEALGLTG